MSNSTVLIADMGILVGIFLLGLLAKLFPRRAVDREQRSELSADHCLSSTEQATINRIQPLLKGQGSNESRDCGVCRNWSTGTDLPVGNSGQDVSQSRTQ